MRILKRGADAGRLLLDLVTRDPAFVRGGELDARDIPVFTFHSLEPRSFERTMGYVQEAGYQAIGLDASTIFDRTTLPTIFRRWRDATESPGVKPVPTAKSAVSMVVIKRPPRRTKS